MKNIEEDEFKVTVDSNLESLILIKHKGAIQIRFATIGFAAIYEAKYPWEKPKMQIVEYNNIQMPKLLGTNILNTNVINSNVDKLPQLTICDRLRYSLPFKYDNIIQLHFYHQQSTVYMTAYYLKDNIEYNDTLDLLKEFNQNG